MLASIVANIIEWFISRFIAREVKAITDHAEAQSVAQNDADRLKKAQTDEEKADALKHITDDTFFK